MLTPEDNLLDYVDDYVHGLLSPDEARLVARFCENSKLGQAALEDARRRYEALQQLPPAEASESLIRSTLGAIDAKAIRRERRQKRYLQAVLLVTAASALFISLLNIYYYRLQASPYDLRLLGQAQLLSGSQASLRVAMVDHASGAPVAGVPVHVALYNPSSGEEVQLASATTDEEGVAGPRFQLPSWEEGSYQLRVAARTSRGDERLEQVVQLRRDWRLMLSTDKPVYQPGQTIRLRSLALKKPDLKPIAGQELMFTITDPKGNIIFKRRDVTSRFGIASADCPLAREILEGAYQIRCAIGETASEQTVKVEKYVLPKFQVAVSLGASYYAPGERVTGHVQADYFFGKPVVSGQVQIEVQATDVGPQTLHRVTLTTDEMGRAPFEFRLPNQLVGREQDSGAARFLVAVQVTDTAGQTATAGSSRVVTANPIHLEVIPECGRLVVGVRNRVYVVATYADGRPCKARLIINGQEELQTDQLGIAMAELRPVSDESLTVKAIDSEGRIGQRTVQLASGANANDFVLRTDKALYRGGETMQLSALGGGSEPVLVDLIRDGQTILSCETTPQATVKDDGPGVGTTAIDLPPDLSGTLEIVAYRFGSQGLPVRKSRVVYVQPANQVGIQVTLDQGTYRPGEQAQIKLRLTGEDGRPAPGAISLKAVDEAVYAVLNQKSNLEETFFLLEQELLEPVYTIYPGWNPQLFSDLPTLERERFQQALLARTAQHVEGPGALPPGFCGVTGNDPAEVRVHSPFGGSLRNPFTLSASSFPAKLQEVLLRREAGLHLAMIAWGLLGIGLVLAGVVGFAWFYPKAFLITGVVGTLFGCAGMGWMVVMYLNASFANLGASMATDAAVADMDFAEGMFAAEQEEMDGPMEAPMAGPMEDPSSVSQVSTSPSAVPLRIRQWFPETLVWRPELITDDRGEVSLDVDLADSITTWRLSSSAVTADGRLGGAEHPIKVFQPFFVDFDLPVSLTRHDEVAVPVVAYNYLDAAQTIQLEIAREAWFQWQPAVEPGNDEATDESAEGSPTEPSEKIQLTLELAPGEVRSARLPIRVLNVGRHTLQVTARGSGIADAVRREIEVVANGTPVEQVASGSLLIPCEETLSVPSDAIPGSVSAVVKLYPSTFSQLVEGLDAIFAMPSGCFEQTSSTTYPNVLALDYLRRTGKSAPEIEAKARQYIHLGYQRLIGFEVDGGGFDWFGNPPANRTLTAYGLTEFEDMARVHDVDPRLIERTRNWLLRQRRGDGSWSNEAGMLDDGLASSVQRGGQPDLASTAYIAWAVFGGGQAAGEAPATRSYLLGVPPQTIDDPYVLALTINALLAMETPPSDLAGHLDRLESLKQVSEDGKQVWWEQSQGGSTMFYGSGQAGSIETTAMASLALLRANRSAKNARAALQWLVEQKDPRGTWHSTQATILALKALLAGTEKPVAVDESRRIEIRLGGETHREVVIPPDQSDVLQMISLSDLLLPGNDYALELIDRSNTGAGFQVAFQYHREEINETETDTTSTLRIDLTYDRQRLDVDDTVTAVARVVNQADQAVPMVIVDLPIPGGFALDPGELDELVGSQVIAKYQVTARQAIVYLRGLQPNQTLELRYRLRATMPVKVAVPDAEVYEYYDPARRARGGATRLEASEA